MDIEEEKITFEVASSSPHVHTSQPDANLRDTASPFPPSRAGDVATSGRACTVTCEGVLAYPSAGSPTCAVLLLNPHPLLGGNMENNVIRHLWRRLAEDGAAAFRFNYRGVGGSGLVAPEGMSAYAWFNMIEAERRYEVFLPECHEALDYLRGAVGAAPLVVIGYSLGSVLAAMLAHSETVDRLVAISPPNARISIDAFALCAMPKLFIAGGRDMFFDAKAFDATFATLSGPKAFTAFPESDHFYRAQEEALYEAIRRSLP
ncbi:MAG: alpha/beta fold hydrolase [Candidatus Hydrogenedentes bacterium]|nr:alpha/beta fold hydrolase [Candidatus Hydrogenedentota bacterium]